MTRINVVPPRELSGKHLVAEYRELPRVFALVRAAGSRGLSPRDIDAPDRYVLGPGHVKFFYDKLLWLSRRQTLLVLEMIARGYKPQFRDDLARSFGDIPQEWWGDYRPTKAAMAINRARLRERGG